MTTPHRDPSIHLLRLVPVAALLLATPLLLAAPQQAAPQPAATAGQAASDRSNAYYHYGLAHLYEEMAVNAGRSDYATQAVEEYKLALDADPNSAQLQDGLADLYFKIGRVSDAVSAAQEQVKRNPNDIEAHTLLGQVYLRSLGDMQGAQASDTLQHAIAEYEILERLKPDDLETKLLLGQLYALNNDHAKAEAEFKAAQSLDSNSEEVVLNMARLYEEEGDAQRAAATLAAVPVDDRTARIEFALGNAYDQLKEPKEAAAAYRRSLDMDSDNPDAERDLANALLEDGQLDAALAAYNDLAAADPNDAQTEIRISEIERRQGHYDAALATLEKAKAQIQSSPDLTLELEYNEALLYDTLGKYDQAVGVLTGLLSDSAHADGKYSDQEKQNRAIFLDRLGSIDREEDKTADAVAAYKQIVALGGEYVERGYDGEIDAYRDAHQWKDATAAAAEGAKALPKDRLMQLTYAGQLADVGQADQGIALAKAQLTGTAEDRDVEEALAQIYIRLKRFKEAGEELDMAEAQTGPPEGVAPASVPTGMSVAPPKDVAPNTNPTGSAASNPAQPPMAKPVGSTAAQAENSANDRLYVLFLKGELYDREKMYDQAEVEFRKALAIDPENAAVLNYLGYMLADRGQRLPEALKLIQKAVDIEPQNGAYLDSLGWVYFKLGEYSEAEENLHKAIQRMDNDPTVLDHLGEVYEKTGNLKMAVEQWERSMAEYAQSLPADAEPEDVQKVQHRLEDARVKLAKLTAAADKGGK